MYAIQNTLEKVDWDGLESKVNVDYIGINYYGDACLKLADRINTIRTNSASGVQDLKQLSYNHL